MPTKETRSEYAIELTACFTFSINTTLEGLGGLSKDEIEEMIEADWMWISVDTRCFAREQLAARVVRGAKAPERTLLDDEGAAVPEGVDAELRQEPPHLEA